MTTIQENEVFISYSHHDKKWLDELQTHLKPLVRKGEIAIWDDTVIKPGANWRKEIEKALYRAKVAVLLVTPSFLASDFIDKNELPPLLKKAETQGLTIMWIPVSASSYQETKIADYQAACDPKRPLGKMRVADRNDVFVRICSEIKKAVDSFSVNSPHVDPVADLQSLRAAIRKNLMSRGNEATATSLLGDRNGFEKLKELLEEMKEQGILTWNSDVLGPDTVVLLR